MLNKISRETFPAQAVERQPSQVAPRRLLLRVAILAMYSQALLIYLGPVKDKISFQTKIENTRVFGLKGAPGEKGRFIRPNHLKADSIRGRLYLTDTKNHQVLIWDLNSGSHLKDVDVQQTEKEIFNPWATDYDSQGNLYVLDWRNYHIFMFSPKVEFIRSWQVVRNCMSFAVNKKTGDAYVLSRKGRITVYDQEGEAIGIFGEGELPDPIYIGIDKKGNVYVMDRSEQEMKIFTPAGRLRKTWKIPVPGVNSTGLSMAKGLLLLDNVTTQEIVVLSKNGKLKKKIKLNHPFAVKDVDSQGNVFINGNGVLELNKCLDLKLQIEKLPWPDTKELLISQLRGEYNSWWSVPYSLSLINFPVVLTTAFYNFAVLEDYKGVSWLLAATVMLLLCLLVFVPSPR